MHWVAPSERDTANGTLEEGLSKAADQLRDNSGLTSVHYSRPVLGLIFLRFAEVRFAAQRARLESLGPGRCLPLGLPRTANANYFWTQLFHSAFSEKVRAGWVMSNSTLYTCSFEQEIHRQRHNAELASSSGFSKVSS